jgi:hypothetical protein
MRGVQRHMSFANVMSVLAVFIALGGVGYAASLGKNTVRSKQIAKNAVKTSEIAKNAVRSHEVLDASLGAEDFKPGALPAGAQGPPGPTFAAVEDRDDPVSNPEPSVIPLIRETQITTPTSGRLLVMYTAIAGVDCSAGEKHLGLYVDGTPVPDTQRDLVDPPPGNPAPLVAVFGVTGSAVPAGTHTLSVLGDCPDGDMNGLGDNPGSASLGAILLGS